MALTKITFIVYQNGSFVKILNPMEPDPSVVL